MTPNKVAEMERKLSEAISQGLAGLDKDIARPVDELLATRLMPNLKQIYDFCEILAKWNRVINLVSSRDVDSLLLRHVLDSAFATAIVHCRLDLARISQATPLRAGQDGPPSWLDIGAGAGFPGMVISLMFPESKTVLCEPRAKRAHFLKEARCAVNAQNVTICNCRLDEIPSEETFESTIAITRATGMREEFIDTIALRLPRVIHFAELTTQELLRPDRNREHHPMFIDNYLNDSEKNTHCVAIWPIKRFT